MRDFLLAKPHLQSEELVPPKEDIKVISHYTTALNKGGKALGKGSASLERLM